MKLKELKTLLQSHPTLHPRFILPDGDYVPDHFHLTEVGHVTKRFIDCGGTLHDTTDLCLLQTYVADDVDHRLDAATFAKILALGNEVLPPHDLDVQIEYDCCVVSQYPITTAAVTANHLEFQLGEIHTDCLAKEKCGIDGCASSEVDRDRNATVSASCC